MTEEKTRYKMYKAKKRWMVAGITMFGTALGMSTIPLVNADNAQNIRINNVSSSALKENTDNPVQNNSTSFSSRSSVSQKDNNATNKNNELKNNLNSQHYEETQKNVKNNATTSNSENNTNISIAERNNPTYDKQVQTPVVVHPNNLASSTSNGTTNPTMTSDEHRADYHLTTQSGWGNDVQTIVKNPKGYYDVYFLQGPGGAQDHGTTVWEHTTTTDFKNFGPQNTAIGVGKGGDSWYGAATGSVVINQGNITGVPKGDMVAYFTGYHNVQSIYAAYSDDDGKTFDHVLNNGNPIVNYNSNGASQDPNNFRDASVVYWNGKMLMYCAEENKFGVFSSTNGLNWNHVGDVNAAQFAKGMTFDNSDVPVECPVLRNMTDNQGKSHIVLFYGGKNNAAHQTTGTYYVVGHLDNNGLFVADHNAQRLDLGSDFYAANFDGSDDLGTANPSIISLGWIGNWGYTGSGVYANENNHTYPADRSQLSQRLGSYSLPRKLTLNSNGMISDAPLLNTVNNGNVVQCSTDKPSNSTGQKQVITEYDNNQADTLYDHANEPADSIYDLHFSTKNGQPYKGRIYIDIWQGADNVRLNFDPTNGWMQCRQYAKELDNDPTGMNASNNYQNGTLGNKGGYSANTGLLNTSSFDIKVFCDKDSVEFFFPNGQAYTVARFATQITQDFKVYTQDPTGNNQLSVQKLMISNNQVTTPSQPVKNQGSDSKPASNKPANSNSGSTNKPSTGTSSAKPANGTSKPASGTSSNPGGATTNKPVSENSNSNHKPANIKPNDSAPSNQPEQGSSASTKPDANTKPSVSTSSSSTTNSGSSTSKVTQYVWENNVNYVVESMDKDGNITLNVVGTYHDSQTKTSSFTEDQNTVYQNAIKHVPSGYKISGAQALDAGTHSSVANGVQTTIANWNITVDPVTSKPDSSSSSSNNKPADTKPNDSTPSSQPTQGGSSTSSKPDANKPSDSSSSSSTTSSGSSASKPDSSTNSSSNKPVDTKPSDSQSKPTDSTSSSSSNKPVDNPSAGNTDEDKPVQRPDGSKANNPTDVKPNSTHPGQPATNADHDGGKNDGNASQTENDNQNSGTDHETDETGNGPESPVNGSSSATSSKAETSTTNVKPTDAVKEESNKPQNGSQTTIVDNGKSHDELTNDGNSQTKVQKNGQATVKAEKAKTVKTVEQTNSGSGNNGTDNNSTSTSADNASVSSNSSNESTTSAKANNNNQGLPQTGEEENRDAAEIGLAMLGVVGTVSIGFRRKRYGI